MQVRVGVWMWRGSVGTQLVVLYVCEVKGKCVYTVEPLYSGHHWDPAGYPV